MVAIMLGADNGFFYAGQVMHFSCPFTVFLIYHKQSITHHLTDYIRKGFFLWIKQQCIDTHKFNNVFVIFPDMFAKWWVWDILSGNKANITLSEQELLSFRYPFWMLKKKYEQLQQNATRTCIPKEESQ